jgi:hypothetical protein
MNKIETIVDVITGNTVKNEIPFTAQELTYSAQVTAQAETAKAQEIATKESAQVKLFALGLTTEEVEAILGIAQ